VTRLDTRHAHPLRARIGSEKHAAGLRDYRCLQLREGAFTEYAH
jgi:hypothetical protein